MQAITASYLRDFSRLLSFVMTAHDNDFVVFSHGHRAHVVFGPQILGQRSAHNLAPAEKKISKLVGLERSQNKERNHDVSSLMHGLPDVGGSLEMTLPVLSARGCDERVELHCSRLFNKCFSKIRYLNKSVKYGNQLSDRRSSRTKNQGRREITIA